MTETTQTPQTQGSVGAQMDDLDEQLAARLVAQARSQGISLVGPDGLRSGSPSWSWRAPWRVSSATIWATSMATRPAATAPTPPSGTRPKKVLTEVGPVQLDVPRDRDATFQPRIVRKRQRRLGGVEDLVVSLVAKGLTTGEVAAHLAEIYGTEVSRQTISGDHRPGPGGPGRLAVAAAGPGLSGAVRRRDRGQAP
jgi:putative transposase